MLTVSAIMDSSKPQYSLRRVGHPFTKDYKVYFERNADKIAVSPFHDIPLHHDEARNVFNMVVEVPRWTNAKFEISRGKSMNPITQDTLDGNPRFTRSCFPYKGYIWNYGALPQTWEDPHYTDPDTDAKGDNDPIDACEIGRAIAKTGDVKQVKILGVLGLLDEGETDWKLIVIDVTDPLADKLHDINDVEKHLPGLLDATRDWFRIYMVPNGYPPNEYALEGKFMDKPYALKVVKECSEAWRRLVDGKVEKGGISLHNTTLSGTPGKLDPKDVGLPADENLSPAPVPQELEEWFYVDRERLEDDKKLVHGDGSLYITLDLA